MCVKCNERKMLNELNRRRSVGVIPSLDEMDRLLMELRQREAFETEQIERPF